MFTKIQLFIPFQKYKSYAIFWIGTLISLILNSSEDNSVLNTYTRRLYWRSISVTLAVSINYKQGKKNLVTYLDLQIIEDVRIEVASIFSKRCPHRKIHLSLFPLGDILSSASRIPVQSSILSDLQKSIHSSGSLSLWKMY